jgi:hypothetical protein
MFIDSNQDLKKTKRKQQNKQRLTLIGAYSMSTTVACTVLELLAAKSRLRLISVDAILLRASTWADANTVLSPCYNVK